MTDDLSRPVATSPDSEFTLTIDDALERYARAGLPRTPRTSSAIAPKATWTAAASKHIGEKFLISPASVDKHIAYIEEVRTCRARSDGPPTCRDNCRRGRKQREPRQGAATGTDKSRQVATAYVERLESENEFFRGQIGVKDKTIEALLEREREPNHIVGWTAKDAHASVRGRPEDR